MKKFVDKWNERETIIRSELTYIRINIVCSPLCVDSKFEFLDMCTEGLMDVRKVVVDHGASFKVGEGVCVKKK